MSCCTPTPSEIKQFIESTGNAAPDTNKEHTIESAKLRVLPLDRLSTVMQRAVEANYKFAEVQVVECPDLRKTMGFPCAGICGNTQYVEAGGVPNLLDPAFHFAHFSLVNIAKSIHFPGAFFTGAGATSARLLQGKNAEFMACTLTPTDNQPGICTSQYADVGDSDSKFHLYDYPSDEFGLLGNFLASKGETGPVIKVIAKQRTGSDNFITCLRKALEKEVTKPEEHMGFGGVFRVNKGRIKAHVMPRFKNTVMKEGPEVEQWLRFYEMGPGLVCLSTFLTGDPTGNNGLNLRLEHTHFFSKETGQGGHYHTDCTPDEIEYEAYFVPCSHVHRVGNAYKR